ncbi:MAG: smalltalk protein [Bacteroidaceae bacterium]|nr:smalltalk protein [Bacteroidaceae bacterium]
MNDEQKKKNGTWEIVLKVIIAVASAIAGALGISACVG